MRPSERCQEGDGDSGGAGLEEGNGGPTQKLPQREGDSLMAWWEL